MWCAPADRAPSACDFWYFLGFAYNPWWLRLSEEGEPECVGFIGVWPREVNEFRDAIVNVGNGLVRHFDLTYSSNGRPEPSTSWRLHAAM